MLKSVLSYYKVFDSSITKWSPICLRTSALYSSESKKAELPKNVIEDLHTAHAQAENGLIYDKKPFKINLNSAKTYHWCLCGQSKHQPFCDGTHKVPQLKIKLRPIKFKVEKDGDYWLCNCKQTSHRPFCDGTHKREDIQAKIK